MPHLQRGASAKMLMRTHRVVPEAELRQRHVQVAGVGNGVGAQCRLECAEQALNAAVLPWAGEFGEAQPYARQAHEVLEPSGMVNGMVVELERQWNAMLAERQEQRAQQSPDIETPYAAQCDIESRAVIDDPEHDVRQSLAVANLAGVEPPGVATRLGLGHPMLPLTPPTEK